MSLIPFAFSAANTGEDLAGGVVTGLYQLLALRRRCKKLCPIWALFDGICSHTTVSGRDLTCAINHLS